MQRLHIHQLPHHCQMKPRCGKHLSWVFAIMLARMVLDLSFLDYQVALIRR